MVSRFQVKVFVRVRPRLQSEYVNEEVVVIEKNSVIVSDALHLVKTSYDKVFDQYDDQEVVFNQINPMIERVIHGFNCSVFAYGQTGSGKTYTMFGAGWNQEQNNFDGIIPRAIDQIFQQAQLNYTVLVSFLQIYNEKIYDLLQDNNAQRPLNLREEKGIGIYVENLAEYVVQNSEDCLVLVQRGDRNRAVRATRMNIVSSRSHCIFQVSLESDRANEKGLLKRAKLNLCDLAGSEKFDKNNQVNKLHLNEMKNINLSLTNLGKIIQGLQLQSKGKQAYLPYRDSKLTRLLKDSLGGNTQTCFIATITPIDRHIAETINTLHFADRAKQVMITVKKNQVSATNDLVIQRLQREIQNLREMLQMRRHGGNGINELQSRLLRLQNENERLREIKEGITVDEVLHLKEENKRLRLQIQQLGDSTANSPKSMVSQNSDKTFPNINCSPSLRPQMFNKMKSYTPSQSKVEIRLRGRNAAITKQTGFIDQSYDDFKGIQQREVERRQAMQRLRFLERLEQARQEKTLDELRNLQQQRIQQGQIEQQQKLKEKERRRVMQSKRVRVLEWQQLKKQRMEAQKEQKQLEKELERLKYQRRKFF